MDDCLEKIMGSLKGEPLAVKTPNNKEDAFSSVAVNWLAWALVENLKDVGKVSTFVNEISLRTELDSLKANFESGKFVIRNNSAYLELVTFPILLEYLGNIVDVGSAVLVIDLVSFLASILGTQVPTSAFSLAADAGSKLRDGYFHPHVNTNGKLCWGEAEAIVNKIGIEGRLPECIKVILTTLNNYSDKSPYRDIAAWYANANICRNCASYGESITCYICRSLGCHKCIFECSQCRRCNHTACAMQRTIKAEAYCVECCGICRGCSGVYSKLHLDPENGVCISCILKSKKLEKIDLSSISSNYKGDALSTSNEILSELDAWVSKSSISALASRITIEEADRSHIEFYLLAEQSVRFPSPKKLKIVRIESDIVPVQQGFGGFAR